MIKLGLFKRRECWVPTYRGGLVLLAAAVMVFTLIVVNLNSFLTLTCAVRGDVLVVEGWLPDYALEGAKEEFLQHNYRMLLTTGGPLPQGTHLAAFKTYAELGAATLKSLGLPESLLVAVPAPPTAQDRTYASAVALRQWLSRSRTPRTSFDVYSLGAHSRRTLLMFKKALGDSLTVGVLAASDRDYDPNAWWTTSNGVRTVMSEAIAYCYARFFFFARE